MWRGAKQACTSIFKTGRAAAPPAALSRHPPVHALAHVRSARENLCVGAGTQTVCPYRPASPPELQLLNHLLTRHDQRTPQSRSINWNISNWFCILNNVRTHWHTLNAEAGLCRWLYGAGGGGYLSVLWVGSRVKLLTITCIIYAFHTWWARQSDWNDLCEAARCIRETTYQTTPLKRNNKTCFSLNESRWLNVLTFELKSF